ncbi:MAG: GTPase RsgA [Bacillota bacterium]|nr:GTPase RsgA [Bacillota bacterium]
MLEIRKDGKGKHTTSRRELFFIPSGGAVIDTPGKRELGVETADIGKTFADIEGLSAGCRFNDCSHTVEPGCAVKKAVENGEITAKRLENYLKLKKEARYDGLDSKQIEKAKIDEMFSGFGGIKNARDFVKNKNKRPR